MKQYRGERIRNNNRIKYFDELSHIEDMIDSNESLEDIYKYMQDLIFNTHEKESNYISIPRYLEDKFEQGKDSMVAPELLDQFILATIKSSYNRNLTYKQAFCKIYGVLTSFYDKEKINKKINDTYTMPKNGGVIRNFN